MFIPKARGSGGEDDTRFSPATLRDTSPLGQGVVDILASFNDHLSWLNQPLGVWRQKGPWTDEEQRVLLKLDLAKMSDAWGKFGIECSLSYWLNRPLKEAFEALMQGDGQEVKERRLNWNKALLNKAESMNTTSSMTVCLDWIEALSLWGRHRVDEEAMKAVFMKMVPEDQLFGLSQWEILSRMVGLSLLSSTQAHQRWAGLKTELTQVHLETALIQGSTETRPRVRL